jgi:hypothetical protein
MEAAWPSVRGAAHYGEGRCIGDEVRWLEMTTVETEERGEAV